MSRPDSQTETQSPRRVAVIGAGPAGITAAYKLAQKGVVVDLFEASETVGGLARSLQLWGQSVDIGPHRFFSTDRRVNALWLEVAGKDYRMVERLTRIYYKKKFFNYPLKLGNVIASLGLLESMRCVFSAVGQRIVPMKRDGSFEAWVTRRFGRRLFQIFFKTYTEKLWGISCRELDEDFAAQRIKKLSLTGAILNALKGGKGNKHKTLVEQFAYPTGGSGMIYQRMAEKIREWGGKVHLNTPIERVRVKAGKAQGIEFPDGRFEEYDNVISTMPISHLVQRMDEVPAEIVEHTKQLTYRNTLIVFLEVEGTNHFPDNWVYVHSANLETGRITNFRNWVPELYGDKTTSILALEYWCNFEDQIWGWDDQRIIELGREEMGKTGLIGEAKILNGSLYRIPRCYPVYKTGYKASLQPVEKFVSSIEGLQAIGRYGAFKYNNQDHSILMGLLAAENLTGDARHDLWAINTDYETYQESATIEETALEMQGA